MTRIDELKRRIFDLSDAEKAELKLLMEKRNADPERRARLIATTTRAGAKMETGRKAAQMAAEAAEQREVELARYVNSLRQEDVYLGNRWGNVPTWAIPEGMELGSTEGIGDCKLCGEPLHTTNQGLYACRYGHVYDFLFEWVFMRSVVQWMREPDWDRNAAGIEWAVLGREVES